MLKYFHGESNTEGSELIIFQKIGLCSLLPCTCAQASGPASKVKESDSISKASVCHRLKRQKSDFLAWYVISACQIIALCELCNLLLEYWIFLK